MDKKGPRALQEIAFQTLLWVLSPDPGESGKAYMSLFQRLTAYFRSQVPSLASDAEDLAEETLISAAESLYLRLSGYKREDLSRWDAVHKVPQSLPSGVYESERENLWPVLRDTARNTARKQFYARRLMVRLSRNEQAQAPPAGDNAERLERALRQLSGRDRYLIKKYYAKPRESRKNLAVELGLTNEALAIHARRVKEQLRAALRRRAEPEEEAGAEEGKPKPRAEFTAFFRPLVNLKCWHTLLTYMHLHDALQHVKSDARKRFTGTIDNPVFITAERNVRVARGAEIRVVPHSESLEFDPAQAGFIWLEDYHCAEFRFRAAQIIKAGVAHAAIRVSFYVGPILIAEIALTIALVRSADAVTSGGHLAIRTTDPYERVFVSYSNKDAEIANQLEKAYIALGLIYVRDIRNLRSGEKWAGSLLRLIENAEIFQLLWSEAAKRSHYVQKEWRHALSLGRDFFIRPVYWQQPMPRPPRELAELHFAFLDVQPITRPGQQEPLPGRSNSVNHGH